MAYSIKDAPNVVECYLLKTILLVKPLHMVGEVGVIWVISLRANRIKNDATVSELRMIADVIEQKLLGG